MSFGFKHGIPADADLVFDVRFLPNPFYIDELKYMTGNDKGVQEYVMGFPEAGQFMDKLEDMLRFLIPNYIKEAKIPAGSGNRLYRRQAPKCNAGE